MNSSLEIDKTKYFLGYHYDVGKVLALNIAPQPGMFFINGETNSVWVWNALNREWIDTNRVDSGLKGMLTDEVGNSPADFIPSPQVGVKESYFYVAKTDTPQEVVFTHFKNGNNSVSVAVPNTSVIILYWNGDYWETSLIPMNIDLSEFAKSDDMEDVLVILSAEAGVFSHTFITEFEGVKLSALIPLGAQISLSGDVTAISARSKESDSDYIILRDGDITTIPIGHIKNYEGVGELNISWSKGGVVPSLGNIIEKTSSQELDIKELEEVLYGGSIVKDIEYTDYPARINGEESISGYFKGYKVDLTPYVGKYNEVYFRGSNFKSNSADTDITRGVVLDKEGNIESIVPFVAEMSNGWQSLPITENSKTLWASYNTISEGGEVWLPEYVMFTSIGNESVLAKVERLDNAVERIDNAIEVILPSDIYLMQGKISQLFFKGFIKAVNPYDYDIKVMCNVGKTFPRYYEIDSNVPVGDYPLTIQVRNNNLKILGVASTVVHIIEQVAVETSKNILCIGASATATGCWAAELKRLLNNSNLTFVGRKQGTDEVVNLEATGGWGWSNFIASDAPFPEGNFSEYANTYCNGKIDVLIAHIGVNNSLWENSKPETAIAQARTLIDGYFADFPEGKMIITAIPMPDEGTNVYANTNTPSNINRYGTISSFLNYNKALYDLVEELKEKYNISYVPTNVLFDTDYAYPKEYKSINSRMDMFKEMVGVNGVHPIPEGSYMVSDAILPVFYKKIVE